MEIPFCVALVMQFSLCSFKQRQLCCFFDIFRLLHLPAGERLVSTVESPLKVAGSFSKKLISTLLSCDHSPWAKTQVFYSFVKSIGCNGKECWEEEEKASWFCVKINVHSGVWKFLTQTFCHKWHACQNFAHFTGKIVPPGSQFWSEVPLGIGSFQERLQMFWMENMQTWGNELGPKLIQSFCIFRCR